jgi:hypothetical protein
MVLIRNVYKSYHISKLMSMEESLEEDQEIKKYLEQVDLDRKWFKQNRIELWKEYGPCYRSVSSS